MLRLLCCFVFCFGSAPIVCFVGGGVFHVNGNLK